MSETVRAITTTRADLFAIGRILAQSLSPEIFYDKDDPLIVAISGSWQAGKSIFSETIRSEILPENKATFKGRKEYDEYWRGTVNGTPIEIDFLNAAWGTGYSRLSPPVRGLPDVHEKDFLSRRGFGGISFIQNPVAFNGGGLDLWLEDRWGAENLVLGGKQQSHMQTSPLAQEFHRMAGRPDDTKVDDYWLRYVEITVRDVRLLESPRFMQAARGLPRMLSR